VQIIDPALLLLLASQAALLGLRDDTGNLLIPLLAVQLLWINIIADGPPALALGIDRNPGVMSQRPHPPSAPLLARANVRFILITGILKAGIGAALFFSLPFLGYSGSATQGEARSAVRSGLSPGEYTLVASVADNLGNVGRDTLQVRILEEGRFDLLAVQPFPNPFRGRCAVSFEVTAPARARLGVYTLSGRKVRGLDLDCPQAGRFAFDWDGLDEDGDALANGTYLYRIRAEFDEEGLRSREQRGALVKMAGDP